MGVDVMRWMYALQNVEQNLLFGYGPADDIRKKLITFWNVYSFYATYAAVDGFDPIEYPISKDPISRFPTSRYPISKYPISKYPIS